jgi:integrase
MAGITYMQRRSSGIYEFRKRLPKELAGKPAPEHAKQHVPELINPDTGRFKRELTVSLGTNDPKAAKRKDLAEALRAVDLFEKATLLIAQGPAAKLSPQPLPEVSTIEAWAFRKVLAEDEQTRRQGDFRRQLQTPEERSQWPDLERIRFGGMGMEAIHLEVHEEELDIWLADYRDALARYDITIIQKELHAYLTENRLPIEPNTEFYQEAGLAILRGYVEGYEAAKLRQIGKNILTPAQPNPVERGPKLSEALAQWKAGSPARGGKKPSHSTVREAERVARYFTEWHGDLHLADITKEKARDFRNALAALPTRLKGSQRKMSFRQLIESTAGKDSEPLHAATVNKYLVLLVALVSTAERDGYMDRIKGFTNPFSKLSIVVDKRNDPNRRRPFSEADLKAIFSSPVYATGSRPIGGRGEAAYWMPLVSLLTGARLNEIAQLRLDDLRQDPETGIWIIDIDTEGDRSVKTVSSRRQVPLHGELIRLGLLRYREGLLNAGAKSTSSLWPELSSADPKYRSTAWSKWFNRYLRETIGIKEPSKVFHSFRHTFKRLGRNAGLTEEVHDALTGHVGSGSVGRDYGDGFGLPALGEAVSKIVAPVIITSLPVWEPAGRPKRRKA